MAANLMNSTDCERYMENTGRLSSRLHEFQLIFGTKFFVSDWFYFDSFMGIGLCSHVLDRSPFIEGMLVERGRFWQEN